MTDPMQEGKAPIGVDLGRFPRPVPEPRVHVVDLIAVAVSLLWLALVGVFFFHSGLTQGPGGALGTVMVLVAIFLPLALIWVAAMTARTTRAIRAEAQSLQLTIENMRQALMTQGRPAMERRLEEIATSARQTESAIATFTSRRDGEATQPSADRKAALVTPRPDPSGEDQPA
ncbi:MAG: hypothetical protein ORN49_04095, partial [Rhodobacteraceae bacterium]|nr:hypothetical protein [Paracoccaceae bacterium]